MRHITIWHNVQMYEGHPTGMLYGYRAGDAVTPVFTYVRETEHEPVMYAEDAFHLFNAPEEYLSATDRPIALRYRANRLRSLSVGDVVQVDGEFFACESVGFKELGTGLKLNVSDNPFDNFTDHCPGCTAQCTVYPACQRQPGK